MHDKFLIPLVLAILSLSLLSACSNEDSEHTTEKSAQVAANGAENETGKKAATEKPEPAAKPDFKASDVMERALDFSSSANTKKSIKAVKVEAGGVEVSELMQALRYLQDTDTSIHHNKKALYKKLHGKSPNQIGRGPVILRMVTVLFRPKKTF